VPQRHRQLSSMQRVLGALAILNLMVIGLGACDSGITPRTGGAHSSAPANSLSATATAPGATQTPLTWVMPNLVGSNLQSAQDRIQDLTNFVIAMTVSHDATGAGRHQVFDRNWKVCSQNIPPGSLINRGTRIDFGAVKLDERCP
jgi:hypothetical protein